MSALVFLVRRNHWKIKGVANVAHMHEARLERVRFDICGDDNQIRIGAGTALRDSEFIIRGNGHRVVIGECCRLTGVSIWMEDDSCQISIGGRTSIEGSTHLAATENGSTISIGSDCMFAQDIDVRTGDSHSILDAATGERINRAANVAIGDHVWVTPRVAILKGVVIGKDSIIGTGSCVTRAVPANSLAAGVPAVVRRRGVQWRRERV